MHTSNIIQKKQKKEHVKEYTHMNTHTHKHTNVTTIGEKGGHGFEKKPDERVWRKEMMQFY